VTTPDPSRSRLGWHTALEKSPDCLNPDRLSAALTQEETAHVAGCVRCQSEVRLWTEFRDSRPGDDQAMVDDLVTEFRRRHADTPAGGAPTAAAARPRTRAVPSWLGVAALLAIATAVGYGLWEREPALRSPGPDVPVYRSTSIETVAPRGDVSVAPAVFEWVPLDGAVRYDVHLREVDGTEVWSASSTEPRLPIPSDVRLRMVPGKTLIWDVAGLTARGDVAARSVGQRFRVGGQTPSTGA
jgi:hypothetical protein